MPRNTLKQRLETIRQLVDSCLAELDGATAGDSAPASVVASDANAMARPLQIANKISDCEEAAAIHEYILDQRSREPRVLLCFYISHQYFGNGWLTSGEVAQITSELGVKIDQGNVSRTLAALRKYLESGAVRKRGLPTPYRLNRAGLKHFKSIIHPPE